MFGAAQPLLLKFPLDRGIFLREYATGSYGAAAYFISKTIVELPQMFLTSVLTWLAFYWIAGLQGPWIYYVIYYWLTGLSAASTALVVGCLAANAEVASQAAPPIFVLQLLFAGVFLPVSQVPEGLRWLQYICSLKYGINLLILNEFGEATREAGNWTAAQKFAAETFIEVNDIYEDDWYIYLLALIGLFCFFRVVAIIALARRASAFF